MGVSLTELRQRLFELADQVIDSGEPLVIVRRGVRLRLVREEGAPQSEGRLARLKVQQAVIGAPLAPSESPAVWSAEPALQAAEPTAPGYGAAPRQRRR